MPATKPAVAPRSGPEVRAATIGTRSSTSPWAPKTSISATKDAWMVRARTSTSPARTPVIGGLHRVWCASTYVYTSSRAHQSPGSRRREPLQDAHVGEVVEVGEQLDRDDLRQLVGGH